MNDLRLGVNEVRIRGIRRVLCEHEDLFFLPSDHLFGNERTEALKELIQLV